jgi:hypothetical protein
MTAPGFPDLTMDVTDRTWRCSCGQWGVAASTQGLIDAMVLHEREHQELS